MNDEESFTPDDVLKALFGDAIAKVVAEAEAEEQGPVRACACPDCYPNPYLASTLEGDLAQRWALVIQTGVKGALNSLGPVAEYQVDDGIDPLQVGMATALAIAGQLPEEVGVEGALMAYAYELARHISDLESTGSVLPESNEEDDTEPFRYAMATLGFVAAALDGELTEAAGIVESSVVAEFEGYSKPQRLALFLAYATMAMALHTWSMTVDLFMSAPGRDELEAGE